MRFSTALALASAPLLVFGANQTVTVGDGDKLVFNPATIMAKQGDFINFQFATKNHSVTQSTFAAPCTKSAQGFNSGFLAAGNSTSGPMATWTIQITNDSTPVWMYCAQKTPVPHCKMGMVFSINPTPEKSHDMFVAAAMASNETAIPAAAPGSTPSPSGSAPGSPLPPSGSPSSSASSDGAAPSSASSTGGDVGGVASAPSTSQDASNAAATNGASRMVFKRGAAGLLTVAAVGAILL